MARKRGSGWVAGEVLGALLLVCGGGSGMAQGAKEAVGFDLNDYPGDATLPVLRKHFEFTGYWLNNPPGARSNGWKGKRETLVRAGFGFLVLWNGRLDAEILRGGKSGKKPEMLGRADGEAAIRAAKAEGFPAGSILFLDQEEGGRMLPEQAGYLLAWTETVAREGYKPGVYGSGQPVPDGPGKTITTAEDIQQHVKAGGLHEVALWVAQDACPPAPGCVVTAPPMSRSGTPGALAWQYAQSPRRPEITRACAKTYGADGNCYAPELKGVFVDLNVARSADPSGGR